MAHTPKDKGKMWADTPFSLRPHSGMTIEPRKGSKESTQMMIEQRQKEMETMAKFTPDIDKAHAALPRAAFLSLWTACDSLTEFVDRCVGADYPMTPNTAKARADRYRKGSARFQPVPLKVLKGEQDKAKALENDALEAIAKGDKKALASILKEFGL